MFEILDIFGKFRYKVVLGLGCFFLNELFGGGGEVGEGGLIVYFYKIY